MLIVKSWKNGILKVIEGLKIVRFDYFNIKRF